MATALPAATVLTTAGHDVTVPATAAAAEIEFTNTGREILEVVTGTTTANLALVTQKTVPDGSAAALSVTDRTKALLASKTYLFGPFDPAIYNDANGKVQLTLDALTDIKLAVLKLNPAA